MSRNLSDFLQQWLLAVTADGINVLGCLKIVLEAAAEKKSFEIFFIDLITSTYCFAVQTRQPLQKECEILISLLTAFQFDCDNYYYGGVRRITSPQVEQACFSMCRAQMAGICFALQPLDLPAWCTVLILLEVEDVTGELARRSRLYHLWSLVTKIKHFQQKV